jgi:hypothetical protein
MSGTSRDQTVLQIASAAAPASIDEVITVMEDLDAALQPADGVKWFNALYLMVTKEIGDNPPAGGWAAPAWVTRLDVTFAGLYFAALAASVSDPGNVPSSWQALFEARYEAGIDRIQFALAGMNAHINHDLAQALGQTNEQMHLTPAPNGPEHTDFEHVNGILGDLMPRALNLLAGGFLGEAAQDSGKVGRLLAIWDIGAARDLAWDFAAHLGSLPAPARAVALFAQDKLTGALGRSLLLPLP